MLDGLSFEGPGKEEKDVGLFDGNEYFPSGTDDS